MNAKQLLDLVVSPTLKEIGLHSDAAEQLVIGTIYQESRGEYLKQLGNGPALGLIQMEPATHDDIWRNYLVYNPYLRPKIKGLLSHSAFCDTSESHHRLFIPSATELIANLKYAVAMCRIHYLRVPKALPMAGDIEGMAQYWKDYYNTANGSGKATEFVFNYPKFN